MVASNIQSEDHGKIVVVARQVLGRVGRRLKDGMLIARSWEVREI
jgi:hypothetical protein